MEKSLERKGNQRNMLIVVSVFLLIIMLGVISYQMLFLPQDGEVTARIIQDGTLLYTIPLSDVKEEYQLTIENEGGARNILTVSNGGIAVSYADCPDQVCVERGNVYYSSLPVICMPNRLVIEFEKEGANAETDTEIS